MSVFFCFWVTVELVEEQGGMAGNGGFLCNGWWVGCIASHSGSDRGRLILFPISSRLGACFGEGRYGCFATGRMGRVSAATEFCRRCSRCKA